MLRLVLMILALAIVACVGDSSATTDAGPDASVDAAHDAPGGPCVFGTSHFGDGCKFGP